MDPYKPWDFCNDIHCRSLSYPGTVEERRTYLCENCKAYKMHQYLKDNGQILEEGNPLLEELERLQAENEQLKSQPQPEAIARLLDLLKPDVERQETLIVHDPRLIELLAVYREIRPK